MNIEALTCSIILGGSIVLLGVFCLHMFLGYGIPIHPATPLSIRVTSIILAIGLIALGVTVAYFSYPEFIKEIVGKNC